MTDDDYDTLSQKQLASIKRDMRKTLEDAAVRATHKVMAELETDCVGWFGYDTGVRAWFETNKGDDDSIPLYKAPRQWIGLTDEEVQYIADSEYEETFVRLIEAKLKEKNTLLKDGDTAVRFITQTLPQKET
jgi:hypothetical protein